nr:MAG TPA: hypothetical protein [Caudoviricetes sp.]
MSETLLALGLRDVRQSCGSSTRTNSHNLIKLKGLYFGLPFAYICKYIKSF